MSSLADLDEGYAKMTTYQLNQQIINNKIVSSSSQPRLPFISDEGWDLVHAILQQQRDALETVGDGWLKIVIGRLVNVLFRLHITGNHEKYRNVCAIS